MSAAVVAVCFVLCSCNSNEPSDKELREFKALERAIDTMANAPPEDREIRLAELEQVAVTTDRLKTLKKVCSQSYRSFIKATLLLADARKKTENTEAAIAKASAAKQDGGALDEAEKQKLKEMSQKTATSLEEVNQALDRAEELVESCDRAQKDFEVKVGNI